MTIKEAVHTDIEHLERGIYDWVRELCLELGAGAETTWCRSRNTPPPRMD